MPKVSVIIPTYNAAKTIIRAVDSVLRQTFQDFEIIIVDDVSQDNTLRILRQIEKKDKRITVFQNSINSKSAFTRNEAILRSKGKYIMQLDDDDYCDSQRVEKQVAFLDKYSEYDFVGSNVFLFEKNHIYGSLNKPEYPNKKDLIKTSPFLNPSMMFRKEALKKVGGYRISWETVRGQDYDLFLRLYVAGMRGYNIQENLTYYYQDEEYVKKIKWKSRIGEMKFRYRNFKYLDLLPSALFYVFKPIVAMMIPNILLKQKYLKRIKTFQNKD